MNDGNHQDEKGKHGIEIKDFTVFFVHRSEEAVKTLNERHYIYLKYNFSKVFWMVLLVVLLVRDV
jgi:hypothetical protein